jgi:hypothetical protein
LDPADSYDVACIINLISTADHSVKTIRLLNGSTSVQGLCVSPDGKYAYAVHLLSRYQLPTTQLERGWVNTNAFSIIDLTAKTLDSTLLLDRLSEGAADPWGIALAKDGKTMWVSLAGVHQLARVELGTLHGLLKGEAPDTANPSLWRQQQLNHAQGLFKVADGIYQIRGYDLANLKRRLRPAIHELEQRAFLTPMPDHERFRKLRAGQWQVAFEKARAGRRTPAKAEELTTEADRLVEALIERGVAPGRAMEIVAVHPPDCIQSQLEVFDWLVTRKDPRLARNPAGFLISSIQGYYAAPRGYVTA